MSYQFGDVPDGGFSNYGQGEEGTAGYEATTTTGVDEGYTGETATQIATAADTSVTGESGDTWESSWNTATTTDPTSFSEATAEATATTSSMTSSISDAQEPTETSSSSNSSSSSDDSSDSSGGGGGGLSNTTKIAIAVPVAVVGAAIIAALIFFLLRRRRRQRQQRLPSQALSTPQLEATSSIFLPAHAQVQSVPAPIPHPGPITRRVGEGESLPPLQAHPRSPGGGRDSAAVGTAAAAAAAAAGVGVAVTNDTRERDLDWRTSEERAADARPRSPFNHPNDTDSDDAVSVLSDINDREAMMRARNVRDDDMSSVSSFGSEPRTRPRRGS